MSSIKVADLAYFRLQVPDLDRAAQFLVDFGLISGPREGSKRYFRGTDPSPYCYVLQEGPPRFLGFAFHAQRLEDLDVLARTHGLKIEPIDGPGGGSRVRLREPNGAEVDVVFGTTPGEPIQITRQAVNTGAQPLLRAGELYRLKRGAPTPVKRLAHVVMGSPNPRQTVDWFHSTLGTLSSDEIVAGPQRHFIGAFIRIDKGDEYVDHHSLFVIGTPTAGLNHVSFEVPDIDAVLADHHYLKSLGRYDHLWGVGRHLLGAQVFDYWADPFGYPHEHWADSDRLNASAPMKVWEAHEAMISQWGEEPPERFKKAIP